MKRCERLKSPKNKHLQGLIRVTNEAKVVPNDEDIAVKTSKIRSFRALVCGDYVFNKFALFKDNFLKEILESCPFCVSLKFFEM